MDSIKAYLKDHNMEIVRCKQGTFILQGGCLVLCIGQIKRLLECWMIDDLIDYCYDHGIRLFYSSNKNRLFGIERINKSLWKRKILVDTDTIEGFSWLLLGCEHSTMS